MEKKSLISLIEEDDDKEEDEDQETDQPKKRYHLAKSIINFITGKRERETEDEESILASLFDKPSNEEKQEIESLSNDTDPIELASSIVEDRIEELVEEVDLKSMVGDFASEDRKKIEALENIRDYLATDELKQDVIIEEVQETIINQVNYSEVSPSKPDINQAVARKIEPKPLPHKHVIKRKTGNKPVFKSNMATRPTTEAARPVEIAKENAPISRVETITKQTIETIKPEKLLTSTRQLIETLYTRQTETSVVKPETLVIEKPEIISKHKYLDISKKISADNFSLRQFFNKNNFNQKTRTKIISEILSGENPAKVLGREMKKRGKFKKLIQSYSEPSQVDSIIQSHKPVASPLVQPKPSVVNNKRPSVSLYSPGIWLIVISSLLIIMVILYMILK